MNTPLPSSTEYLSSKDGLNETKYKIVMRLAERWAVDAFKEKIPPEKFCEKKFATLSETKTPEWSHVTKVVLTAFVIREHDMLVAFFHD